MLWFILLIVAIAFVAYKFRVPLLARITGQSEQRIQRALERKKGTP